MTTDSILDDLFHACAWEAFIAEARAVQGWPDPEKTRERAYRLYEEDLADRSAAKSLEPADDPAYSPKP